MIRSLRGRLFIGLTAIIILTGVIAGAFAYKWAFDEAIEIQDSVLIQLASVAQNGGFSGGPPLHGVEEDSDVWLIELGKTPQGSADDRQLFTLRDGLQVATWKNLPVRALLRRRSDGSRFAVAQPIAVRDETARDMALRTLLPILALIPCLMLVTALVIARSLRPMMRLAGNLDSRPEISTQGAPMT
jgi:two-component system OmpR family sensor kinase